MNHAEAEVRPRGKALGEERAQPRDAGGKISTQLLSRQRAGTGESVVADQGVEEVEAGSQGFLRIRYGHRKEEEEEELKTLCCSGT